jgi:hypothetical protein
LTNVQTTCFNLNENGVVFSEMTFCSTMEFNEFLLLIFE